MKRQKVTEKPETVYGSSHLYDAIPYPTDASAPVDVRSVALFSDRIAGKAHAELLKHLLVHLAEHHGAVNLTAAQQRQRLDGLAAVLVEEAEHRNRHQHFI